ncbi:ABC transporter substrate-binding protein [Mesorhizobium sp. CAU 1732]|uniref:ABC transporter substrate-binding protein n=1 Tax=Mesorhizobium sp. CAU 1732 TaxID=3140358 RepID=UPI0032608FA3
MSYMLRGLLVGAGVAFGAASAYADPIRINFVPTTDGLTLYVAADQGMFEERGLEVELAPAPNPSVMISALAAGSSDIGHTVVIPVLAASQAGIELSIVAGASGFPSVSPPTVGVIAKEGSDIQSPRDLEGKPIGVVGLESYHQVMVQRWMEENGADYSSVRFVEMAFPQMQNLLNSGNVDAVVAVDPFYSRMINEGIGYTFGDFVETMPDGVPIVAFVSLREWAEANPDKVTAFREALSEANEFIQANEDEARRSLAKWTNLPEPVVATARWGSYYAEITEEGVGYWVDLMRDQGLIGGSIEAADLIPSVFQ